MTLIAEIATTTMDADPSEEVAHRSLRTAEIVLPPPPLRIAVSGTDERTVAALALHLIDRGYQIVLTPGSPADGDQPWPLRAGHRLHADDRGLHHLPSTRHTEVSGTWNVAMYSSGSTATARAYGFTRSQLDVVAGWYKGIYRVTPASVIVTSLPACYNFTFMAGLYLASTTGARLHLSAEPGVTLQDAARLASAFDRVVVLANPVLLQLADRTVFLPDNTLVDSGGAPLSTPSIESLRQTVGDVREGYGLTETASLTHFDSEGSPESLGSVGTPMPGVTCSTTMIDERPRLVLSSPAVGVELRRDGRAGAPRSQLLTGDLANIDDAGRLRLLGRADDCHINGFWPRDTLDLIGGQIGTRCGLVRQPAADEVHIRMLGEVAADVAAGIRSLVCRNLSLSPSQVSVEGVTGGLLPSRKLPRAEPASSR